MRPPLPSGRKNPTPPSPKAGREKSLALAEVLGLDGDARLGHGPAGHRAFGLDLRPVMLGRVEGEVAGHVHVELALAQHAPFEPRRRRGKLDALAIRIYRAV